MTSASWQCTRLTGSEREGEYRALAELAVNFAFAPARGRLPERRTSQRHAPETSVTVSVVLKPCAKIASGQLGAGAMRPAELSSARRTSSQSCPTIVLDLDQH